MHALTWSFTYFCDTIQIILIKIILQPSKNSISLLMCVACYVSHSVVLLWQLYTSTCYIKLWDWVFFMKTCLYHFCVRTYVRMCAKDEITSSKSTWLHIYIIIANSTYILSIKTCLHKCINVLKWIQPNYISTSVTYFTGQQPQATCTYMYSSLPLTHIYIRK